MIKIQQIKKDLEREYIRLQEIELDIEGFESDMLAAKDNAKSCAARIEELKAKLKAASK